MGIVVQKYGGSSLADAAAIKRVARRIVESKRAGHDVVVAVSAMGDSTDELLDLANEVSPLPPAREMDMLLTAGERIAMSLLVDTSASLSNLIIREKAPQARAPVGLLTPCVNQRSSPMRRPTCHYTAGSICTQILVWSCYAMSRNPVNVTGFLTHDSHSGVSSMRAVMVFGRSCMPRAYRNLGFPTFHRI